MYPERLLSVVIVGRDREIEREREREREREGNLLSTNITVYGLLNDRIDVFILEYTERQGYLGGRYRRKVVIGTPNREHPFVVRVRYWLLSYGVENEVRTASGVATDSYSGCHHGIGTMTFLPRHAPLFLGLFMVM